MLEASHEEIERRDEEPSEEKLQDKENTLPDRFSVLFIGVDDSEHRGQSNPRADALIIATYNKAANTVKLTSLPRDSYVHIPKIGRESKLAHAHAFGGVHGTVETVEELIDIPINYYVRFNFHSFIDVIDALGGVYFDVPYEIIESDSNDKKNQIHLQPGYQHLNGEEALAVVRTRKKDSDIERGKRQLEMLQAIAQEAASITTFFKLEDLIQAVGTNLKTNFTVPEIHSAIAIQLKDTPKLEFRQLKGTALYKNGMAIYEVDAAHLKELQKELQLHLGIESTN